MKDLMHGAVCVCTAALAGSLAAAGSFLIIEALLPAHPEVAHLRAEGRDASLNGFADRGS